MGLGVRQRGRREDRGQRRADAGGPGDREGGPGDDRPAACRPAPCSAVHVPLAVQLGHERRRDEQTPIAMISAGGDLVEEVPVVLEGAAEARRGQPEQDEDRREAGDEQQAGGEHPAPVGAARGRRPRRRSPPRDSRGPAAARRATGTRPCPAPSAAKHSYARGGIGLHTWFLADAVSAALNADPWLLRMPLRGRHGCDLSDPAIALVRSGRRLDALANGARRPSSPWGRRAALFSPFHASSLTRSLP